MIIEMREAIFYYIGIGGYGGVKFFQNGGTIMIMNLIILAAGFFALIKGADIFVDASAALAKNFKVPGLIIGLTVVALGTSAPELAVSVSAAIGGSNEIALSNVVGSNIFNLLGVLGVCAAINPLTVDKGILKRDFPISIITTVLTLIATSAAAVFSGSFMKMGMEENAGNVSRIIGALLIMSFIAYIAYLIIEARKHPQIEEETGESKPVLQCVLFIAAGLALIVGGGQAVVYSAKEIARAAGMTETLIGLTIVAVGTSLPELVTSIVAAKKGETGLAIGNVVGSNIFNLLFILGLSALICPVAVNAASVYDMIILIAVSLIAYGFCITSKTIKRAEGL